MPIHDDLPGWRFRASERAAGVLEIEATHANGMSLEITAIDPELGLHNARAAEKGADPQR